MPPKPDEDKGNGVVIKGVVIANTAHTTSDEGISCEAVTFTDINADNLSVEQLEESAKVPTLRRIKGIFFMTLGATIFSIIGALTKGLTRVPSGQYVMCDGGFGALLLLPYTFFLGKSMWKVEKLDKVIIRCGGAGFVYTIKVFCIKHMSYGDAMALIFTAPLFCGIIARIFLKERYTIINVLATVSGIIGIVLISQPSFIFKDKEAEPIVPLYAGVAVIGAILAASTFVAQRCIGDAVHYSVTTCYVGIAEVIGGCVYQALFNKDQAMVLPTCYEERGLLFLCGILSGVGYVCLNIGMSIEKSGPATLIRNLDTVLAFVLGLIFFGEVPDYRSIIGAVLIILGTVAVTMDKAFNNSGRCEF